MVELHVTTRAALASLWLPWCVWRDNPETIARVAHEPEERRPEVMQLRVGDLDDDRTRSALATQRANDGAPSSLEVITERAQGFAAAAASGRLIVALTGHIETDPAVFLTAEGPMLHEGCHRACALFESHVDDFELRARIDELFAPWAVYDDGRLRER